MTQFYRTQWVEVRDRQIVHMRYDTLRWDVVHELIRIEWPGAQSLYVDPELKENGLPSAVELFASRKQEDQT